MYSNKIENKKKDLSLDQKQVQILLGSLLGDAHLESQKNSEVARLKIEHSYKQKDYVDWLYQAFEEWVRTPPKEKERKVWGKRYRKYYFATLSHKELEKIRKEFYQNNEKIVPKEKLASSLNKLGLAVWYMDDGSIKSNKHRGVFLNTQGFSEIEVKKLQDVLYKRFNIKSTTRKDKNGKQIYLGGDSGEKLINLTRDHILSCFEYKIPKPLKLT